MSKVYISKLNELYLKVDAEPSTLHEIREHFTFFAHNYQYHPLVKKRLWDGRIPLLNIKTHTIYVGLLEKLKELLSSKGYEYDISFKNNSKEFSKVEAEQFISTLNIPCKYELRDHQIRAFTHCVRNGRAVILSSTNSGKSLSQYYLARFYEATQNKKILIIVPSIQLVRQLRDNFISDYGYNGEIQEVMGGTDKENDNARIFIGTWQSLYKLPSEYFEKFGAVFGDECHGLKGKSAIQLMQNIHSAKYRFGFTGTLEDVQINKLVLEGMFGPIYTVTTNREMIDKGVSSEIKIKILVLKHPKSSKALLKGADYQSEVAYLIADKNRNRFIKNLSLSLKGNTLIIFNFVDGHGKILNDMIKKERENTFYISGEVKLAERIKIIEKMKTLNDYILTASYKTFQQGIDCPNIDNIILALGYKGKVRLLQTIGRGLRVNVNKPYMTLYDIADDFGNKQPSYSLQHLMVRIKHYHAEKFTYNTFNINLEEK